MVVASARRQASVTLGHALSADANRKWRAGKRDEALASYRDGAEVWALTGDLAGWAANRDMLATNLVGVLQFEPDWQDRLKAMELHLDIRKQLMAERQLSQQVERERLARQLSRNGLER